MGALALALYNSYHFGPLPLTETYRTVDCVILPRFNHPEGDHRQPHKYNRTKRTLAAESSCNEGVRAARPLQCLPSLFSRPPRASALRSRLASSQKSSSPTSELSCRGLTSPSFSAPSPSAC